jgi:hypothetical protein
VTSRAIALASILVGCAGGPAVGDGGIGDGAPADVGRDAARPDAFFAPPDAGSSLIEPAGAPQLVSTTCSSSPRLTANGEGWAVWWPDGCDAIVELDADGAVGSVLSIAPPPLDPTSFAPPMLFDDVAFAHGSYAIAVHECSSAGPCSQPQLAAMDRAGVAMPWVAVAAGDFLGLAGWDDRGDWLDLELRTTSAGRVPTAVLRDASLAVVSATPLSAALPTGFPYGALYRADHVALAWWDALPSQRALALLPDGTVAGAAFDFPLFIDDADAVGDALAILDVLPYMSPTPPPRGVAILDPTTGAQMRRIPIRLEEPVSHPHVAAMPELGLAGLCWTETAHVGHTNLYVQILDLDAGELRGIRTLVAADIAVGQDCGWNGSTFVVVWADDATHARGYRVMR